jgi:hypothetical protein
MKFFHKGADRDPKTGKPVVSSAGKFMGWNTIFGRDGDQGGRYMTRIWFWRLRLHIFHRGDSDPDPHDHPWDFATFPLTSYVEEVSIRIGSQEFSEAGFSPETVYTTRRQVVPAFRLSFRPATHCHRVLGAYAGSWGPLDIPRDYELAWSESGGIPEVPEVDLSKKIVTIVWISKPWRKWGFLKARDGRYCWIHWKEYVLGGGKDSPCQ